MQYLGGKHRLANDIVNLILTFKGTRTIYIEPFMGGGSILAKASKYFDLSLAGDISLDLMIMWQSFLSNEEPEQESLCEEEYNLLKSSQPSALRALAGYGCSFGGKWFGGYARGTNNGGNYFALAKRNCREKCRSFHKCILLHASYEEFDCMINNNCVVYCDPPYYGTARYGNSTKFNHDIFWETMRRWARRGAMVLISEYTGPSDFKAVWHKNNTKRLNKNNMITSTEKVFIYET